MFLKKTLWDKPMCTQDRLLFTRHTIIRYSDDPFHISESKKIKAKLNLTF